jgi:hypothetical protein
MPDPAPREILLLGDERARARRARDWATADRIKAEMAAAGWRVIDAATLYSLERLPPPVVEVDGRVLFGSSEAVPSRLEEPAAVHPTVVLVADDRPGLLQVAVTALHAGAPEAQLVVVANAPSDEVSAEIGGLPESAEVVWLARRLGTATALNAGIRRARGAVVVLLDARVVVGGEVVAGLASALDEPDVAVAGLRGLATADLVHFEPTAGAGEAVAVNGLAMAFRRADYAVRGPLDEHFTQPAYLDAWWSLVLRDVRDDAGPDAVPGRAVVIDAAWELRGADNPTPDLRLARKQRYRFLRSFATRRDLLRPGGR